MIEFLDKYNYKIKTIPQVIEELGEFPRKKNVAMCHGVFDVVHPGHLRHLAYAKSKATFLVVSITADIFINKANFRPHIPESIRALNLAAFEMVDYVVIDLNATPIENIKSLKPDIFAKGFEYSGSKLPAATAEEVSVVTKYGGKVIFTPGDFVLSSSKLIENSPPDISLEKIVSIMKTHNINFASLKNVIKSFAKVKVHVVGDTIVDNLTETTMIGGQIKTPTLSVKLLNSKSYVGGAGIVALHLKAAGADVTFTTLLGNDNLSTFVIDELTRAKISLTKVNDDTRPTTEKKVIICDGYRLLKVDNLDNSPISDLVISEFQRSISSSDADVTIFSDFRHGIFHQQSIYKLIEAIKSSSLKVADSQVASRWGNILDFPNFDLITPNEREARFSLGDQDSTIGRLAGKLMSESKCRNLILKLGERGLLGLMPLKNSSSTLGMISIDSMVDKLVDSVGAGDALLAYATLTLQITNSLPMASLVGSLAAACECEFEGNIPVKREDILDKLDKLQKRYEYSFK